MIKYVAALLVLFAMPLAAQERIPSQCLAVAEAAPQVVPVAWNTDVPDETVRLHYINHAAFLLRSTGGLNIVTDFTGFTGTAPLIPDVVTMNHAHGTHWTPNPDPAIPHVLPGWGDFGEGISHNLDLGEVLIRNVSTDIRSAFSGVETNGNSIFIFEMAGLCIGHLGHLHHEPSEDQYARIGRLDVVMAAVDGGTTLDHETMMRVIRRFRASIMIPMHWFSEFNLDQFLDGMRGDFQVVEVGGPTLDVSRDRLPSRPTIMVLQPEWLNQ